VNVVSRWADALTVWNNFYDVPISELPELKPVMQCFRQARVRPLPTIGQWNFPSEKRLGRVGPKRNLLTALGKNLARQRLPCSHVSKLAISPRKAIIRTLNPTTNSFLVYCLEQQVGEKVFVPTNLSSYIGSTIKIASRQYNEPRPFQRRDS
jgi:hypothetical protein